MESFQFIQEVVKQNLAQYTLSKGGADKLLFMGRRHSLRAHLKLDFWDESNRTTSSYELGVFGTLEDGLSIRKEIAHFHKVDGYRKPYDDVSVIPIGSYAQESRLKDLKFQCRTVRNILNDLQNYRIYHFHDTGPTAAMRRSCEIHDNRFLRPQAENLAAYLYWIQETQPATFEVIEGAVRQIAPFFDNFDLAPLRLKPSTIQLEWKERGSDAYFNAAAMSGGTLRFICLATLLLQPVLPKLILLDEPEIGLHPYAIVYLADMLRSATQHTQLIVATQSATLINQLEPTYVWCVDRVDGASVFRHLQDRDYSDWLDDYALGDLWEKNLLGATP